MEQLKTNSNGTMVEQITDTALNSTQKKHIFKNKCRRRVQIPENWNEVLHAWNNKKITIKEALAQTGMKQTSFYKWAAVELYNVSEIDQEIEEKERKSNIVNDLESFYKILDETDRGKQLEELANERFISAIAYFCGDLCTPEEIDLFRKDKKELNMIRKCYDEWYLSQPKVPEKIKSLVIPALELIRDKKEKHKKILMAEFQNLTAGDIWECLSGAQKQDISKIIQENN